MLKTKFFLIVSLLVCCCSFIQAQDSSISFRLRAGDTTPFGGFAAVSADVKHSFENNFAVNGGVQYNSTGRTATEIRPAYIFDLENGSLSTKILLHYSHQSSIDNFAVGFGADYSYKWLFLTAGYYYRIYGCNGSYMKEYFNLFYQGGLKCLPDVEEWDLNIYITNCELFELERHYQPSLMVQGWWYPNDWLGVNLGVSYKHTGMFGIASDYYQLYGSTGICYRW